MAVNDRVLYVFKIGEAVGGTESQTYHMLLSKAIYKDIAASLGMKETAAEKVPEGSVKLTVTTGTNEIAIIPVLALTQESKSSTSIKTRATTIYVPRDKFEEALAPNGLRAKKIKGKSIIDLRLPRKRVVTF